MPSPNSPHHNQLIHLRSDAEILLYRQTGQVSGLIELCCELEREIESNRQNLDQWSQIHQKCHTQLVAAEKDAAEWCRLSARFAAWAKNDLAVLESYPTGAAATGRRVWANTANTWLYPGDAVFEGDEGALNQILLDFDAKDAKNSTIEEMKNSQSDSDSLPDSSSGAAPASADKTTESIKRAVRVLLKYDFGGTERGWIDECETAAAELRRLMG